MLLVKTTAVEAVDEPIDGAAVARRWLALNHPLDKVRAEFDKLMSTEAVRRDYQSAMEAAAVIGDFLNGDEGVALNVQVTIIDGDGNPLDLSLEGARAAMVDAKIPVVGPVTEGGFHGDYFIDTPKSWWDALVESGEDFWVETGNVIVTVSPPLA